MTATVALDPWDRLQAADFAEWEALAGTSAASNPFLMPGFVQAAARWLTPHAPPTLLRVRDGGGALIGLACLERRRPNLFVPLPHWRGYRHAHAFQSGLLHAPGAAETVAAAMIDLMAQPRSPVSVLLLHNLVAECPLSAALWATRDPRLQWHETRRFQRPVLRARAGISTAARMRASVLKDLRRRLRRLQDQGEVATRILQGGDADQAAAERHLALEHAGWKGEAGSSLHASAAQRGFFLEMAARLAPTGALVFVETLCAGKVIASTSNLMSGQVLSGFKTGWDPEYRQASPGRLNEWQLFEAMHARWPHLRQFDSQAQENSYLAELLPDQQVMVSGVLAAGSAANRWLSAARALRPLAYRLGHDD
ncbi:GNAT family N-acetyltransferase [Pseudoxanthomonas sp. 22568]|uniref:GNAT family N-acetyltransferase n=1 Tax=Pseudoxanthomonas sp. 22568 TaxID=3453945 RepID=UPI003F850B63